jgi:hypothetical protein
MTEFVKSAVASDLKKFRVKCGGQEISEQCLHTGIFQEIWMPTWTCAIGVNDMNNLLMNIPIRMGVDLSIKIQTQVESEMDSTKEFKFKVSHITDKKMLNEKAWYYTLIGVGEELIKNNKIRVQKSYANILASTIAEGLANKIGITLEKEATDNTLHTIIPNLTPMHAIAQIQKASIKNGAADYLFFQKDSGLYIYKPFEKCYNENSGFIFKQKVNHIRNDAGNIEEDYCLAFHKYQFQEHSDGIGGQSTGYMASKVEEFDFISKEADEKTFNYGDDVGADKSKKLWKGDWEEPKSNITWQPKHNDMVAGKSIIDHNKDYISSRKSNLFKLDDNKLLIQCPGGVKSWTGIGKYCKVKLPSHQDVSKTKMDDMFEGKYLIAAIGHMISRNGYFVNYELVKKRTKKS